MFDDEILRILNTVDLTLRTRIMLIERKPDSTSSSRPLRRSAVSATRPPWFENYLPFDKVAIIERCFDFI